MIVDIIQSSERNTYFGVRKRYLGTIHEWDQGKWSPHMEKAGRGHQDDRVFGHKGANVFAIRSPCRKCGWAIDFCETIVRTMTGKRGVGKQGFIRYYHRCCYEVKQ